MAAPAIGTNLKGSALIDALVNALAAIQEEAVGTAANNRATQIGDVLTIGGNQTTYRVEVRQSGTDTITLHLEAL